MTRMLANTHKAICLDKRDLKKLKNDKIRKYKKINIWQIASIGNKKSKPVSRNKFWVCQ